MEAQRPAVHRTILVVDVAGFTGSHRNNKHQRAIRAGLYGALRAAFDSIGLELDACHHEDRGDGVLVLVPPDIPKAPLVEVVPFALVKALNEHNSRQPARASRFRTRMVLHAGEIEMDSHGAAGNALNLAFRLLEAGPLKAALEQSAGVLAVITSEWFFDEVVSHSVVIDPAAFRRLRIDVKRMSAPGWIWLPDDPRGPEILSAIAARERGAQLPRDGELIVFGSGRPPGRHLWPDDVDVRLDAAGQSPDQVSLRILDGAGIDSDRSASPSDRIRAARAPRRPMTVAVLGVDEAQCPEDLLDVLKALVSKDVRVVLGFRRDDSPVLGHARAWRSGPMTTPPAPPTTPTTPTTQPGSLAERLDRVAEQVAALGQAQRDMLHRQARVAGGAGFDDYATKLRVRLSGLRRGLAENDPQWTDRDLDDCEHAVARATRRVAQETQRLDRQLAERRELRGTLAAYRAAAADNGLAEDLALADLHQYAHDLLYRRAFDHEAARKAVHDYQSAVQRAIDGEHGEAR